MPLTIAICDDNENQIKELCCLLDEWSSNKPFAIAIDEYISAESFLFSYPDKSCDLLLLDIEMKQLNGMELAKKLRTNGDTLPIIFITGYSEFMQYGYDVEAMHYLLKPVNKQKLFAVLDKYANNYKTSNRIILPCDDEAIAISTDDIVFCEASGKKTLLIMNSGNEIVCALGLNAVSKKLGKAFIFCHRSYIVNLQYISSISKTEITTDSGRKIPLSRRLYESLNRAFIDYYKEDEK